MLLLWAFTLQDADLRARENPVSDPSVPMAFEAPAHFLKGGILIHVLLREPCKKEFPRSWHNVRCGLYDLPYTKPWGSRIRHYRRVSSGYVSDEMMKALVRYQAKKPSYWTIKAQAVVGLMIAPSDMMEWHIVGCARERGKRFGFSPEKNQWLYFCKNMPQLVLGAGPLAWCAWSEQCMVNSQTKI